MTLTPSNLEGSLINTLCASASTASLAVLHETPSPRATRAMDRCCTTRPASARLRPARKTFARGWAAAWVLWHHTCPQPAQRYLRTLTSSVVGRHPMGACARRRITVSRATP